MSSVQREDSFKPKNSDIPGPGSYYSSKAIHGKSGKMDSAFASSVERFKFKYKDVPGPGIHHFPNTASPALMKESFGRNASFGMTSKRFVKNTCQGVNLLETPGPGSYCQPGVSKVRYHRLNSQFASVTSRFTEQKSKAPPVGSYNVNGFKIKDSGSTNVFRSTTTRDRGRSSNTPGPTAYESWNSKDRLASKPLGGSFSGSLRFKKKKNLTKVPGPGTYSHAVGAIATKKSYNITIVNAN